MESYDFFDASALAETYLALVEENSFPDEDTGSIYSSELGGSPLNSDGQADEFNSSDVFPDDDAAPQPAQDPRATYAPHNSAHLNTNVDVDNTMNMNMNNNVNLNMNTASYVPHYQYVHTVPDPTAQYSAPSHVTGTQIDQHNQTAGNFVGDSTRPFTGLATTWPDFAPNPPFKSPLPWSITCSGVPEKSRVETQIRLRLGLTHESGQNAWPLLKLDPQAISPTHVTKKSSKDKKEEQQRLAERALHEEHVIMETRVVSAGTNVAEALTRASSAAEVNHVLDSHVLWACFGCIQRERKNAQRKMKGQSGADVSAIDRHSIVQCYCDQYFELNQLRGEFVAPLRVTCYCRHHKELDGFSILVLLFDSVTRALIGTCQTPPVMITDDHKSALQQGAINSSTTVPSTPHVPAPELSTSHSRDSSSDEPDFGPNRKRRRMDAHTAGQVVPQLDRLLPTQGPLSGGLEVTLLGANFQPGMQVRFGSQVTHSTYWGPQTLICICPPYPQPATVPVTVFASHAGSEVSSAEHVFTYVDDGDRRLLELALQIIGMKYHGQVSDPKSVALDIINNQHAFPGPTYSAHTPHSYNTQSDTAIELTPVTRKVEQLVLAAVKYARKHLDTCQLEDGTALLSLPHRKTGATLLHYAALKQYRALLAFLLADHCALVDVNAQDKNGWTPLHHATHLQLKDTCQALVDARANTAVVDEHGHKPLDLVTSAQIAAVFRAGRRAPAVTRVNTSALHDTEYDEELGDESMRLVHPSSPSNRRAHKSRAVARGLGPARWALYVVGAVLMAAVVIYAAPNSNVTPPPGPVGPVPPITLLPPGAPMAPRPPTPVGYQNNAFDTWSLVLRLGGFVGLMAVCGLILRHVHEQYLRPQLNGSGQRIVYWTGAVSLLLATLLGLLLLALL